MAVGRRGVDSAYDSSGILGSRSCRSLERTFLESAAAEQLLQGRMVAICGEPGLGKTQLACAIAARLPADATMAVELSDSDPDLAYGSLVKMSRRIAPRIRKGMRICVIIDDICPADEHDAARLAHAIERLSAQSALVVMTMRPEAEQVLDYLGGCQRIEKSDLMVRTAEIVPRDLAQTIHSASGGVPALVDALQTHARDVEIPGAFIPAYGEALGNVVRASLRETLLLEEREARLAAMILGHGRLAELASITGVSREGDMAAMLDSAALMQIDHVGRTFRCVGLDDEMGLMYCSDVLAYAAGEHLRVVRTCIDVLVRRGSARRAARMLPWLDDDQRRALALRHGLDFLDAGEMGVVRTALAGDAYDEDVSPNAHAVLSWAHAALWSQEPSTVEAPSIAQFARGDDERDYTCARLLHAARGFLGSASTAACSCGAFRDDRMAGGLATHAEAIALLSQMRIAQCCSLLRMHRPDDYAGTLTGALLTIDRQIAQTLAFEDEALDIGRIRASEELFERMGFTPLAGWGGVLEAARDALLGEGPATCLEPAAALAERRGNTLLAAAIGCAAVFSDLARHAAVGAHVRASHVAELAKRAGWRTLEDVAAVLGAICAGCMGEPDAGRPLARRTIADAQLARIGKLVVHVLSGCEGRIDDSLVPLDYLWLIVAVSSLPRALSRRFTRAMPPLWQRRVAEVCSRHRAQKRDAEPSRAHAERTTAPSTATGMEIRVLGGLSVLVNGTEIPSAKLVSRSAGTVLAFLAAAPGHSLSRIALIESVWPGCDLLDGRDRIYQAMSRIRRLVREVDKGIDPIELSRNSAVICFNDAQVHCDIDDFVATAYAAMAMEGADGEAVLEAAREVERLYRGSLYMPLQDGSGIMHERSREMRTLYADVMVLGSEAALKQGRRRAAVRFAEEASMVDAAREDVVCALIRALKASGRPDEALRHYRSYIGRGAGGRPRNPSSELRSAIAPLADGQPGDDALEDESFEA